ncbi:LANO_0H12728g1_1 [Lachancea nothofagi CBS 11611]|uniref:LANO_0H12728g1_1 n=1 Tax=Lachancea nothofagi CBS 11611 TaxID=1266666 RepID=A0A1G4KMN8_9SACH|nr:LANO_0H12728g1_1 [Lachancea nothofagi CBS 11611]
MARSLFQTENLTSGTRGDVVALGFLDWRRFRKGSSFALHDVVDKSAPCENPSEDETATDEPDTDEERNKVRKNLLVETEEVLESIVEEHVSSQAVDGDSLLKELEAKPDNYFEHRQGDEHKDVNFELGRMRFGIVPAEQQELIGVVCATDSKIITADQIIVGSSKFVTKETASIESYQRSCFSCRALETSSWHRIPWERKSLDRLCRACYASYVRIKSRCANGSCNLVCKPSDYKKLEATRRRKVTTQLEDGTPIAGFPCEKCGSAIMREGGKGR